MFNELNKEKKFCGRCGRALVDKVVMYDEYTGQAIINGKTCPNNYCVVRSQYHTGLGQGGLQGV